MIGHFFCRSTKGALLRRSFLHSLVGSLSFSPSVSLTPNWFQPLPWKLVLASSGEEETQVGMEAEEEEDVRASERGFLSGALLRGR